MNKILLFITFFFATGLYSQEEVSINLNFAEKKGDYFATVVSYEDRIYGATRQRDFEIDNATFLGLQISEFDAQGSVIWADSLVPSDINEFYLAEENNLIVHKDKLFSIYSIISPSTQKEFLFNKHSLEGELLISKRFPINGNLSLVGGIVSFNENIFVIQRSSPNKLELLQFDENLNLLSSIPILASISNSFSLSCSQDVLIVSYSTWANYNVEFNCKVFDKDLQVIHTFNDFPISEISSKITSFSSSDGGYVFSWSKDLSYSLADTFPYPTVVYKYNSDFVQQWEYTFAHKSAKQFIGTFETTDGNIFGYGATDELYTFDIEPSPINAYSGWCFLLDSNGDLLWERTIFDQRYSLLGGFYSGIKHKEHFILAGIVDHYDPNADPVNDPSSWFLTLDNDGCWNGNCENIIIIEHDSSSYTNVDEIGIPYIKVYPNPTTDVLHIETPFENCKLQVIDATGKIIISKEIHSKTHVLNLQDMLQGCYYIVLSDSQETRKYIKKILKI